VSTVDASSQIRIRCRPAPPNGWHSVVIMTMTMPATTRPVCTGLIVVRPGSAITSTVWYESPMALNAMATPAAIQNRRAGRPVPGSR